MREEQRQAAHVQSSPKLVFERMIRAANGHDLDAMVACFAPNFRSEQPFYPERNFTGQAGVRKNWSFFFSTMPDFRAEVQSSVVEGETVWAELSYYGTDRRKETGDARCDYLRNSRWADCLVEVVHCDECGAVVGKGTRTDSLFLAFDTRRTNR